MSVTGQRYKVYNSESKEVFSCYDKITAWSWYRRQDNAAVLTYTDINGQETLVCRGRPPVTTMDQLIEKGDNETNKPEAEEYYIYDGSLQGGPQEGAWSL